MISKSTLYLFALGLSGLQAGQVGSLEKLDGTQLRGEISFAKGLVTLVEAGGKSHAMPLGEMRHATFAKDGDGAKGELSIARNGLRGRYYSNIKHDGKPIERIDPMVNFDWQEASPAKGITQNGFSVRWEGEVEIPVGGEITFEVESDDGCRLWIDGQKLVDHWQAQSATARAGKIELEADQRYSIKLEYYDAWSIAVARLRWKAEGLAHDIIPTKHLFPLPLTNPSEKKLLHAVKLRSGSDLAGKITYADSKRVRLETADGYVTIPAPAIGYVRFSPDWGDALDVQLKDRPPGCALMNRDFVEGKLKQLEGGVAKFESVLFGSRTIQQAEIRAIKFAEQKKATGKYLIITAADTIVQIDAITTLPGGQVKVRDACGYHLTLPASQISHIRTTSKRSPGK